MQMAASSRISLQVLWDFMCHGYDKSKNAMTWLHIPVTTLAKLNSIKNRQAQERDSPP